MTFLIHPTRNLFFTGKGGVGKTSVACATAVKLADAVQASRLAIIPWQIEPPTGLEALIRLYDEDLAQQVQMASEQKRLDAASSPSGFA